MTQRDLPGAYRRLRGLTDARVALDTTGSSLTTREVLAFQYDWAQARDAVHFAVDFPTLTEQMSANGFEAVHVTSAAPSRPVYLRRPDLGRRLSDDGAAQLAPLEGSAPDVCVVVADGLSGLAVAEHSVGLVHAFSQRAEREGWRLSPVILADQGRVAIGDSIGSALAARLTLMIIGERPGLSAADSLGVYITYGPAPGRTDAERNCVSNIRPGGQSPEAAADTVTYLIRQALVQQLTGVGLKDQSQTLIDP